ncbi:MAG: hypothetical protein ACI4O3_02120 [Oscillospiraceae bacterium]
MSGEKISVFLTRAMLTLFLALCGAALLLGVTKGVTYGLAFGLAAVVLALLRFVLPPVVRWMEKLGALRVWVLLTLLCLVVKTAWILLVRVPVSGDYAVFLGYAKALAAEEFTAGSRYMALFPHIFGYASFLGAFIKVFGAGELLAQGLNVALTLCAGSFLFLLCRRLFSLQAAISVYLFWIVCPSQTMYNSLVLSEPLYTALILGFLLLIVELERRESALNRPVLAGVIAGAAGGLLLRWINGVRPIAAVPVIALLIWILLLKRERRWRMWLPLLGVLLAVYAATGPLWSGLITARIGEEPADTAGYSIVVGFNQESGGQWNQEDSDLLYSYSDQPGSTAQWAQEQMLEDAKARVTSGEIDFFTLMAQKLRTFLGTDDACVGYSREVVAHTDLFQFVCNCFHYAVLLLALWGGARLWRDKARSGVLLAPLFVLGLTMAQMLVEVAGRYHYSIIPMLLLIGQAAWFVPGHRKENAALKPE